MRKKEKRLIALILCIILAIPSSATAFAAATTTADTVRHNWSESVIDADYYTTNADGTVTASCTNVGYDPSNVTDTDYFYLSDDYITKGDYSISFTSVGTATFPNTKQTKIGVVPYYKDANNYLVVYCDWSENDRPEELRCIQFTGVIDGVHYGWNDYWTDGYAIPPSAEFGFEVTITRNTDGTSTLTWSVGAYGGSLTKSYTVSETLAEDGQVGLFAAYDTVNFTDIKINAVSREATKTFVSDNAEMAAIEEIPTLGSNYYVTDKYTTNGNYTVSVDMTGTRTLPIEPATDSVKMGVVPYYVDDNNFIVVYVDWGLSTDRPDQIRSIQITGVINGTHLGWQDIWCDGLQYAPSDDFRMLVQKIDTTSGVKFSVVLQVGGATIKVGEREFVQTLATNGMIGFFSSYDSVTFQNFTATAEENTAEGLVGWHGTDKTGSEHYKEISLIALNGYSVTLGGTIGLNFFFIFNDTVLEDANAYVRLSHQRGEELLVYNLPLAEAESTKEGYKFTCEVAAKEMADGITAQVYSGTVPISESWTYSIQDYAEAVIANAEGIYMAEAIELAQDMINYGAYAQVYFGHNTENLANSSLSAEEQSVEWVTVEHLAPYAKTTKYSNEAIGELSGSNLVLKSETILKMYFTLNKDASNYTFAVNDTEIESATSGTFTHVAIQGLLPQNLDEDYVVTITDGTNTLTAEYSALSYCYNVLNREASRPKELVDVVQAMYAYYVSASDYQDTLTGDKVLAAGDYEVTFENDEARVGVWGNLDDFTFENFTVAGDNVEDVLSEEKGWTNTSGATNYTETDGVITFDGVNTGTINTIAENTIDSNFFVSNEYVAEGDYSISVDMTGAKSLPISPSTDSVMAGIVPYYVDDDNFIVAYVLWGMDVSGDRATDIRSIEITGVINGNFIGWNTIWCDGIKHAPSHKLNLTVNKKDTSSGIEISFALSCNTCGVTEVKTGSVALAYVLTGNNYGVNLDVADGIDTTFQQNQMAQIKVLGSDGVDSYYGNSYSSVTKQANGYLAEATVVSKNGSQFGVEDLWYVTDNNVVGVEREVTVLKSGTGDSGYASIVTLENAEDAIEATDYDYFIPSIIYKDTSDMTTGAIASDFTSDMIYVKETRTGLPMVMARNKTSGNGLVLMHLEPEISVGSLVGGGGAGNVNNAIQYGSVGILRQPEVSLSFIYPCTETPTTYDAQVGGRYHTMTAGNSHTYKVGLIATQSDSYTDAMVDSYKTAYQAETRFVADIDMGTVYSQNVELLNGVYKEFNYSRYVIFQGTVKELVWAGLPWSINLANGEAEATTPYSAQMGFVGQQIQLGYQMYLYGSIVGDSTTKTRGINIINSWTKDAIQGDYFPAVWWKPDSGSTGGDVRSYPSFLRCMVDGMEGMLDACIFAKSISDTATFSEWENLVRKFGSNLVAKQNADGSFYRAYEMDGSLSTRTSTNGAGDEVFQCDSKLNTPIAIRFLVKMYEYTGEQQYYDAAIKAAEYSYNELYVNKGKYVGGTPDNPNTVDKEAAVYAMYAFTSIYQLTGEEKYKEAAEHAAVSAMSWTYVYDFAVPNGSTEAAAINPFVNGGVTGFSMIATGHSGADNYNAYTFFEMFKMYVLTGDSFYQNAALLLENNTKLCTDYDGRIGYSYKALMPEATNVADFNFTRTVGTWLPWSAAANMEPISKLFNAFGSMDLDAIAGNDLNTLKTQLEEYGCGGK